MEVRQIEEQYDEKDFFYGSFLYLNRIFRLSNYWKYAEEKKLAYDYLEPASQKTVKSWKWADVDEYTAEYSVEIWDEESEQHIDIKGMETLVVSFKTTDGGVLGPIEVFLDKKTKKVIGIALRK